jgi:hypothetical protein
MKQSNENETIFKESMGAEWMEKNDSFFEKYDSNDNTERSNFREEFNLFGFITDALFNFF